MRALKPFTFNLYIVHWKSDKSTISSLYLTTCSSLRSFISLNLSSQNKFSAFLRFWKAGRRREADATSGVAATSCGAATSGVAEGAGLVRVANAVDLVGDDVLGHGA